MITNVLNGRRYIGKTDYDNAYTRYTKHLQDFRTRTNKLDADMRDYFPKHQHGAYEFKVLLTKRYADTKFIAIDEKRYITEYNTIEDGLNSINPELIVM